MSDIYYLRGKLHWAKVLGDPVDNYGKDGKEWPFDIEPDADGKKLLKQLKLDGRIKNKEDERGDFVSFRQRYERKDGGTNDPITVVDADGKPWPQNRKLGNGTVADVKFRYKDYGKGKHPGVYPVAIRVLDHVTYETQEFAPLNEDDPYKREPDEFEQASRDYIAERSEPAPEPETDPFEDDEVA